MTNFCQFLFSRDIFAYKFSITEGTKNFSWPWLCLLREWDSLTIILLGKFHIYSSPFHLAMAQSQCLMVTWRDGCLRTLYHSCEFACQQRVLKIFPGPSYLCSKDEINWLWCYLVNLHIYSSPFHLGTTQSQYLMVIERDDGLSTLYYSCRSA